MKKFEILRDLPECATDTKWTSTVGKNGTDRLARSRAATNFQYVKNAVSEKHKKQGMPVFL